MQANVISRYRVPLLVLGALAVLALVLFFGLLNKVNAEPDCGQNAYEWNAVGGHYGRRFSHWCYKYTGDFAELVYDGQSIAEAERYSTSEAIELAFERDTNMCLGGPKECPDQTAEQAKEAEAEFDVWVVKNSNNISQLPTIYARFSDLRMVSGHGPF